MVDGYCLRWNNHQPNFISVFKDLLELEELVDVTLSVGGKHIKAHKVILSACSPYFKMLFTMTPSKHPIIILSDVKFDDLKIIVDFMYLGEISISDEQLPDILELAETLQIRGLYDPTRQGQGNVPDNSSKPTKKRKKHKSSLLDEKTGMLLNGESAQSSEGVSSNDGTYMSGVNNVEVEMATDSISPSKYFDTPGTSLLETDSLRGLKDLLHTNGEEGWNGYILPDGSPTKSFGMEERTKKKRRSSKRDGAVQESKNFLLALEAVRTGTLGFCKAAKLYGLNNRTLWLEYKRLGYPSKRPPIMNKKRTPESVVT